MNKKFRLILLLSANISIGLKADAQTLNLNAPELIDVYRRAQLLGQVDSSVSFTVHPLFSESLKLKRSYESDSSSFFKNLKPFEELKITSGKASIKILPIIWDQQYNPHHPEGFNDGAMIPSKGYQTLISGGVFAKFGALSIQLMPEIVFAQNSSYTSFSSINTGSISDKYYGSFVNKIDMPEKFGDGVYGKVLAGQSSARLTFNPISIGISTENLWWGPGMKNSIIMSNTAPGFKHITINTTRPIKSFLGSFEGQLIAGRLNASGYTPSAINKQYIPKPNDWRYINAAIFTYQPKWFSGLFLGFSRSFYLYHKDMGGKLSDYLPIVTPFEKKNADASTGSEDSKKRDQLSSLFARWIFPKAHAEMYFEFGRNDHSYDLRDFVLLPEHSRAYILGFRKLTKLKEPDQFIQVGFEATQLELNGTNNYRPVESWYSHYQVRDGYTNNGQLIGAGIGPGSNMQSLDCSWVNQAKIIGLQFDRIVHNNDFHYYANPNLKNNWVDLGISAFTQWNYKNLLIKGTFKYINSFNYQHSTTSLNESNLSIKLGIIYGFN